MWWALLLTGAVVMQLSLRWRRSGLTLFDFIELNGMYAFARLWHRCAGGKPAPLPAMEPAIIIANHPSHADPLFLAACCPRVLHFLQAREQYDIWLLRLLFHRAGCIPVARNGRD